MEGLSLSHFVCLPVAIFHLAAAPSVWIFQAVETLNICLRSPGRRVGRRPAGPARKTTHQARNLKTGTSHILEVKSKTPAASRTPAGIFMGSQTLSRSSLAQAH